MKPPTVLSKLFLLKTGIWVNHLDPLGGGTKHGIQDEFNLGTRIQLHKIFSFFKETSLLGTSFNW